METIQVENIQTENLQNGKSSNGKSSNWKIFKRKIFKWKVFKRKIVKWKIFKRRIFLHIPVPAIITEYKVARNRPIRRRPLFTQEFGERVGHDVLAFIMGAAARSVEVEHCGITVGSLWDQCGVIAVGSRWDHGGIAVGSQ